MTLSQGPRERANSPTFPRARDVEPAVHATTYSSRIASLAGARHAPRAVRSRGISLSCDGHKCQIERTEVTSHHPLGRCSNSLHLLFSQGFETNRARCRRFGQSIAFSVTRRSSLAGVDWDRRFVGEGAALEAI